METRIQLRDIFHIPKSQGSWVENNVVRSDGHTHTDLEAITVEKMQAYLGSGFTSETDFVELFNACVEKVEGERAVQNAPVEKPDPSAILLGEWVANLSRMQSQAQSLGMEEHFKTLISKFNSNDDQRTPATSKTANPAGVSGTGKAKETKQKRAASGSTKAAKNSDGGNLSNPS